MKSFVSLIAVFFSLVGLSEELKCNGTEPFWTLSVAGNEVRLLTPDTRDSISKIASRQYAVNSNMAQVIKTSTSTLTLILGSDCRDGMTEENYTHHIVLQKAGKVFYGCCHLLAR